MKNRFLILYFCYYLEFWKPAYPWIEDVVDESISSSIISCGLDADGVVDGEIINDDDICDKTFVDVKFRSIISIESALETFGFIRRFNLNPIPISLIAISEPENDSTWFDDALWGERDSFALGVGGTELGRCITSLELDDGKLRDFKFDVLCSYGFCGEE